MTSIVTTQTDFRYRDDDGNETGATWKAAENIQWVPVVGDLDTPFRLRFQISTTGKDEAAGTYECRLSVNDGSYIAITTTSANGVKSVASGDSGGPYEGDPTTEQMAGSGTFLAGEMDETGVTGSITILVNNDCEIEYTLQLDGANLVGGEKLEFQVYRSGVALDGYTNTPTIASAPTPPTGVLSQANFRWRPEGCNETVNEDTWDAAINVNVTQDMINVNAGIATSLRVEVEETASSSRTFTPLLRYKIGAGGSWVTPRAWLYTDPGAETGNYDPVMIIDKTTTVDGTATTNVLTGSAKGFIAGSVNHDATAANVTLNNQHTEVEWRILISRFYEGQSTLTDGDEIYFKVTDNAVDLDNYAQDPMVTVNIPAGYIGGTGIETFENFSFIKIPDGTLYGTIEDYELDAGIMMLKSTDGGDTWLPVDNAIFLEQNDMEAFSMAYDDVRKVIHCLHVGGSLEYYQFGTKDHSTDADQWIALTGAETTYNHQLSATITSSNQSGEIIIRGTTLYAFYATDTAPEVIYYKKKADTGLTDNWGTATLVDATGGTTDFTGVSAVIGVQDDGGGDPLIHIFYTDYSNLNVHHRSLNTSEALGTIHTVNTDLSAGGSGVPMGLTNAVCWESGGSEYAMVAFIDETNEYLNTVIVQDDGTPDALQIASNSVIALNNPAAVNARAPTASLGLDGTTAWAFYVDDATSDIWRASNADGAGWTGHTEHLDATTCNAIRGQVFTHSAGNGGDTVFGYIWDIRYDDGAGGSRSGYSGTNRYDEYVITVGGGADAMPMAMNTYRQMR